MSANSYQHKVGTGGVAETDGVWTLLLFLLCRDFNVEVSNGSVVPAEAVCVRWASKKEPLTAGGLKNLLVTLAIKLSQVWVHAQRQKAFNTVD